MNSLGIYFGPGLINIVETKGRNILNNIKIPLSTLGASGLEEKVPDEVKMVALFKEELRRNKIEAKEAHIAVSGKDLIIRTFDMPVMPKEELAAAINFEARKYIPIKIEELVLGHQVYFDKANRKNLVLLVGVKRDILDKHLSVFKQLNLKISSIEYAAFSTLRLLSLAGIKDKGVISVVDADLVELDEVNFTVLEDGFPLFSRDMILKGGLEEPAEPQGQDSGMLLEKFKTEIRISLDYYNRKFTDKKIGKTYLIANKDYQSDLEAFAKEIGIDIQFIDVNKCIGKPVAFSLSLVKAYSCSLSRVIKSALKINLLTVKTMAAKEAAMPALTLDALLKGFRLDPKMVLLALLICGAAFGYGLYQKLPLQKELASIKSMRPQVATVNPDASYEELSAIDAEYKAKIDAVNNLIKQQLYLTEILDIVPRVMPEGIWLKDFSFDKTEDGNTRTLDGMAYLTDSSKEFELVNSFADKLKENAVFSKYFKDIKIVSLDRGKIKDSDVANFAISCQTIKEKKRE